MRSLTLNYNKIVGISDQGPFNANIAFSRDTIMRTQSKLIQRMKSIAFKLLDL